MGAAGRLASGGRAGAGGLGGVRVATTTAWHLSADSRSIPFASVRTSQAGAPFDRAEVATCHLYRDREALGSPKAPACRCRRARCRGRIAGDLGDRLFGREAAATRDLPELLRHVPVPGVLVAERLAGTATDAALPPDGLSEHAADARPVSDVVGGRRRHLDCLRLADQPSRSRRRCRALGEPRLARRVARDLPGHEDRRRRAPSKALDAAPRQLRRPGRGQGNQCRHRAADGKQLDRVRGMPARAAPCRARASGPRVAQLGAVSSSLGGGPSLSCGKNTLVSWSVSRGVAQPG